MCALPHAMEKGPGDRRAPEAPRDYGANLSFNAPTL